MISPTPSSAFTPYSATHKSPMPSLISLPIWLPPEIKEPIEDLLDAQAWLNFFKVVTIATRDGKPIDSPVLKWHLLQKNVPTEYQYDVAKSDERLQAFALDQLKTLWKLGQLDKIVERPAIFKLLWLLSSPKLFRFLQQRIEEDVELENKLLNWVERSKMEEVQPVARNALSLLVKANVDMSGQDFKDIRVPGADLSGGQFDATGFDGADLRNVDFRRARLRGANLQRANLSGVNFGQLPTIKVSDSRYGYPYYFCSPDGRWITVEVNGEVKLYDIETFQLAHTFSGQTGYYYDDNIAFSPDGKFLALIENWREGNWDEPLVRLWEVESERELHSFHGHRGGSIRSLAFSPNGKFLATGGVDHTVKIWSVEDGKLCYNLTGHTDKVNSVKFSPNSKYLASGSRDGNVKLWEIESGRELHTLQGHDWKVIAVKFSPNGEFLLSYGMDYRLKLWKVEGGEHLHTFECGSHYYSAHHFIFSPDSQSIASFTPWNDGPAVRLWSVKNGKLLNTLTGHSDLIYSIQFSPDSKFLASCSRDGTVRLWDVQSGRVVRKFNAHIHRTGWVNFSLDSRFLIWGQSGTLNLQRLAQHKARSYWGPSQKTLKVTNALIQDAQGLSLMNKILLKQKGAHGEPAPTTENRRP